MRIYLCIIFYLISSSFADIKSTQGQINFDTQSDGTHEMSLNTTGLGIGGSPSSQLHIHGNAIISNDLYIGSANGSSNLNINGTIGLKATTLNSTTTLSDSSVYLIDSSSDNVLLNLPYAGNTIGRVYTIKKSHANNKVWVAGGGNLIDHVTTYELNENSETLPSIEVVSDGQQWYVLNSKNTDSSISASNLILYLNFDSSVIADSSDNTTGNNATFSLVGTASVNLNAGLSGGALSLSNSGSTDYLRIGNISNIYTQFTCSAYVNMDTHSDDGTVFARMDGTGSGRSWLRFDQANLSFDTFVGGADADGSALATAYNVWNHVTVTYNQGIIKLYSNGNLENTVNFTEESATGDFLIGIHKGLSIQKFKGLVDELKLYNYALSDDEVTALGQQFQE